MHCHHHETHSHLLELFCACVVPCRRHRGVYMHALHGLAHFFFFPHPQPIHWLCACSREGCPRACTHHASSLTTIAHAWQAHTRCDTQSDGHLPHKGGDPVENQSMCIEIHVLYLNVPIGTPMLYQCFLSKRNHVLPMLY